MPQTSALTASITTPTVGTRQYWVDDVRTAAIVLVVNMHACCTYSTIGDWYVRAGPQPGELTKMTFLLWQAHLQAFFMGLLFFLGGHYAARSLARKSAGQFLRERFIRLMLPALGYMLVIHPFIVVGLNPYDIPSNAISGWLTRYYAELRFIGRTGPLWFAVALFVFCVLLVPAKRRCTPAVTTTAAPRTATILLFAATLAVATFLVRLGQPVGKNILNFQLCFFAQYVGAFIAGVASSRHRWLEWLADSTRGKAFGWAGLIGGPLVLTVSILLHPPAGDPPAFFGGWNISAFFVAFWEQFTGVALGIGCLCLFRARFGHGGAVSRWLSDHSFAVYVIHAPILVALTPLVTRLSIGPWPHTLALTLLGLLASYALAGALRAIPGVKRVL